MQSVLGRWLDAHQPCVLCGAADAYHGWCAACLAALPHNGPVCCPVCAAPLAAVTPICGACQRHMPYFDRLQAALRFDYPLSGLIAAWKYQPRYELSGALAELAHRVAPQVEDIDLIVPVPLAKQRLAERGFNQSLVLAQALTQHGVGRVDDKLCWRKRNTVSQQQLDADQRRKNLRNAFGVADAVRGVSILLVDDVATSGSTLSALAKICKRQGAKRVEAWALTRAILRKT